MKNPFADRSRKFVLLVIAGVLVLGFGLIQLVPYRVDNPPVKQEPTWDSPQTRKLAVAACYDCHSNETDDLLVGGHRAVVVVDHQPRQGRPRGVELLGVHQVERPGRERRERDGSNGSMPPNYYTWLGLHSAAEVSPPREKNQLAAGLNATLSGWNCGHGGG